jgi:hypothetical protein
MITTITPKILKALFRKLKSQTISYDLSELPDSRDKIAGASYCVGYRINTAYKLAYRLVFRNTNEDGWHLRFTKKDIIFDAVENINNHSNRYWNVRITPEIAMALLRQRKEHK